MVPIYSVVVPVYNAEKYLESCVSSVMAQRSASSYEIILVDDGSTDGSAQLCDRYARELPCVKVIHQANQGVSAARNTGIAAASGTYILFLDGDDCWNERLLQVLDAELPRQPDLIEFGYQTFGTETSHTTVLPAVAASGMTGLEYFDAHKAIGVMPIASSCTAAFRRQLLEHYAVRFPVGISYGEDFIFHMHCLKTAKSVVSIPESLYRYRRNEQSATHTLTVKKMQDILCTCAQMYRLFPCAMLANYYCMKILNLDRLSASDAAQLKELLWENRDILRHVTGTKMRAARILYSVLGWHRASRLIRTGLRACSAQKT